MNIRMMSTALAAGAVLLLAGCGDRNDVEEAAEDATAYVSEQYQELENTVKEQMDAVNRKISELEGRARVAEADTRAAIERAVTDLRTRRDQLQARLENAQNAGADAWEEAKSGVESAMNELRAAVDNVADRFTN